MFGVLFFFLISCCRSSVLFVCSSSRPLCLASVRVFFVCLSCVRCRVLYLVLSFVVSLCPRSYCFLFGLRLVCPCPFVSVPSLFLVCRSFFRSSVLSFIRSMFPSFVLSLSFISFRVVVVRRVVSFALVPFSFSWRFFSYPFDVLLVLSFSMSF